MKPRGATLLMAMLFLSGVTVAETPLQTTTAQYRENPRQHRLDGVVEAVHQSTVSAQTQGRIEEILFDVDDYVEQGSLIIRLKDTEQKAQLAKAQAALEGAEAQLEKTQKEQQRAQELFQKRLVPQARIDQANAALTAAKAHHEAAKAELMQAQEQFEYTQVRAPYSGIVTHRHIEIGEMANPGKALMSGTSLEQLRVNVDVPQSLIPAIRRLKQGSIQLPDKSWVDAQKLTVFPFAHHTSNTFQVRLTLPDAIPGLFPGMFVKTAFAVGSRRELTIPKSSVVRRSEVTGVYVVAEDGSVSLRHIRAGRVGGNDKITVLAGVMEGEQIALDPIAAGALLVQQRTVHSNE